jgi:hypothetical protein
VVLAFLAGCAQSAEQATKLGMDAESMLVEEPKLPETWTVAEPARVETIDWRLETSSQVPASTPDCSPQGAERLRLWSDNGVTFGIPNVFHSVCAYAAEAEAEAGFGATDVAHASGEDYYNFEYPDRVQGGERAIRPSLASLVGLAADEYEVACGLGDARNGCAVWLFRARYGRYTTQVMFRTNGGGIELGDFLALVGSVDEAMSRSAA